MTAPARRPWWKKKRWAAAGLLWLVAMYPLTEGPHRYAAARGWVSRDVHQAAWHRPLGRVLPTYTRRRFDDGTTGMVASDFPPARARRAYLAWWHELARVHEFPRQALDISEP